MKKYIQIIFLLLLFKADILLMQAQPWNRPLRIANSSNGVTFGTSAIFQDSAGVPCVIKWKSDTLICVFQWFRQPVGSSTWDRVAVKFSYNNGATWTQPQPIIMSGMPSSYQRPFDPTVVKISGDSLRLYYSSSAVFPPPHDSVINTYSAWSVNGINYYFEPGARVDVATRGVKDPTLIYYNGLWRYIAPVGTPQEGAYYYTSPDGLNFTYVSIIPSDAQHSWIGNLMLNNTNDIRFYGSGQFLWYNSTSSFSTWNGYVNTNLNGGDPSVIKVAENNYLIIYVGEPYVTGISSNLQKSDDFETAVNYPNPFNPDTKILFTLTQSENVIVQIYDVTGNLIQTIHAGKMEAGNHEIKFTPADELAGGVYICRIQAGVRVKSFKMVYIK